jgi:hypothetical protein
MGELLNGLDDAITSLCRVRPWHDQPYASSKMYELLRQIKFSHIFQLYFERCFSNSSHSLSLFVIDR